MMKWWNNSLESAAVWIDVLQILGSVVVENAEAGPILAKVFK